MGKKERFHPHVTELSSLATPHFFGVEVRCRDQEVIKTIKLEFVRPTVKALARKFDELHLDNTLLTDTAPLNTYTPLVPMYNLSPDRRSKHTMEVQYSQRMIIHVSPVCMKVEANMNVQIYKRPNTHEGLSYILPMLSEFQTFLEVLCFFKVEHTENAPS